MIRHWATLVAGTAASVRGAKAFAAIAVFCAVAPVAGAQTKTIDGVPVAIPTEVGRETRHTRVEAPRSTLSATAALAAARAVAAQVPGSQISTVLPTGSMRPLFNERAFLVTEPTRYEDLVVGDIITFWHPQRQSVIVHRVLEKRSAGLWTKGDFNDRPDDMYVKPEHKVMRVFAIIYAREESGRATRTAGAAADRSYLAPR